MTISLHFYLLLLKLSNFFFFSSLFQVFINTTKTKGEMSVVRGSSSSHCSPLLEKQHAATGFVNSLQKITLSKATKLSKTREKYYPIDYVSPGFQMEIQCLKRFDEFQELKQAIQMTCTTEKDTCIYCEKLYTLTEKSLHPSILGGSTSKQRQAQLFLVQLVQLLQEQHAKSNAQSTSTPTMNCAGKCYVPSMVENFLKNPQMTRIESSSQVHLSRTIDLLCI
jgi:hypothetical protein